MPPVTVTITIVPSPINLGTGVVGTPLQVPCTIEIDTTASYNVSVTAVTFFSGVRFSAVGLPALPVTHNFPFNVGFSVQATDAGPGTYTDTMQVHTNFGIFNVNLTAKFNAVGAGGLLFLPASIDFGTDVLDAIDNVLVSIQNVSGSDIHITGVDFSDPQISLDPSVVLPLNIPAMSTVAGVKFLGTHSFLGLYTGTATIHTDTSGDFLVPTSISTVPFVEFDPLTGATSDLVFSFQPGAGGGTTGKHLPNAQDLNLDQDCTLIFNGSLWDKPGYEKVLGRFEVFYEDYGVCDGLRLTVQVWRPKATPPQLDTQNITITIGTVGADKSEKSAYFDVNMAGELILATLVRVANTGPVSILGFSPWFDDGGEKVENV